MWSLGHAAHISRGDLDALAARTIATEPRRKARACYASFTSHTPQTCGSSDSKQATSHNGALSVRAIRACRTRLRDFMDRAAYDGSPRARTRVAALRSLPWCQRRRHCASTSTPWRPWAWVRGDAPGHTTLAYPDRNTPRSDSDQAFSRHELRTLLSDTINRP